MRVNELPGQLHGLYEASQYRHLPGTDIVNDYAAYTRSQFTASRHLDGGINPVLIPVKNETEDLPSALLALARAGDALPVVIDNGSTDETAAIATRMGALVIEQPTGHKVAAMQTGIAFVQSELGASNMLFTDADTLVPRSWARAMNARLDTADEGQGVALFGNSILWHGQSRPADIVLSAAKIARHLHRSATGALPAARGHNFGLKFDEDGQLQKEINLLDGRLFGDAVMIDTVKRSGVLITDTSHPSTLVITRNDRVNSLRERIRKSYYAERRQAYQRDYGGIIC